VQGSGFGSTGYGCRFGVLGFGGWCLGFGVWGFWSIAKHYVDSRALNVFVERFRGHRAELKVLKRFRGGLVFKAHRLLYHTALGLRVIKKRRGRPG